MLKLRRSIRVRENILLPNGKWLRVDLDVEAHRYELVRAQGDALKAAMALQKAPTDAAVQQAFQDAFIAFVKTVITPAGFDIALEAYEGKADELCMQLDEWITTIVMPKVEQASEEYAKKQKRVKRKIGIGK